MRASVFPGRGWVVCGTQPTLTSELYLASMGTLVDVVLAAVVREIQALRDVAETETRQLHQLHQSLQSRVEPLFTHRDATTGAVSVGPQARSQRGRTTRAGRAVTMLVGKSVRSVLNAYLRPRRSHPPSTAASGTDSR